MIYLITGGSASGKSAWAGRLAEELAGENGKAERILYIATLADQSEESEQRVERHRKLRENGNYAVEECFFLSGPAALLEKYGRAGKEQETAAVVLFDSLDGFTANVLFPPVRPGMLSPDGGGPEADAERTAEEILSLQSLSSNLMIVSDQIYSDGIVYDGLTRKYMEYTAEVERAIADRADYVIEVVCGIPLLLKGEEHEFSEIDPDHDVSVYEDSDAVYRMGPE